MKWNEMQMSFIELKSIELALNKMNESERYIIYKVQYMYDD